MAWTDLPLDLLPLILAHLPNTSDWLACALVSSAFYHTVTPLLYADLDSRSLCRSLRFHPAYALLQRPQLANHVRNVTESAAIHRSLRPTYPEITYNVLAALSLCQNLQSITWIDDGSSSSDILPSLLAVIDMLPTVRELTIRTYNELGAHVWSQLFGLRGIEKLSIWCMAGPPARLDESEEWAGNNLRHSLEHIELGLSPFPPQTVELLSQLSALKSLRLKGAPAQAIRPLLPCFQNLTSLDTDYLPSNLSLAQGVRRYQSLPNPSTSGSHGPTIPTIQKLVVRANPMDPRSNHKLWSWITDLVPYPGLDSFKLHTLSLSPFSSFSAPGAFGGQLTVPKIFLLDLAAAQRGTLTSFDVGDNVRMSLEDLDCLCAVYTRLEAVCCAVEAADWMAIATAISRGHNLSRLELSVQWTQPNTALTADHARALMLRSSESKLREIRINSVLYRGHQRYYGPYYEPTFEVEVHEALESWQT